MAQSAVQMRCTLNRTHVKANSPAMVFLAVDFRSDAGMQAPMVAERRPLNIALALDCSGSMQEDNKLEFAQQAAISLIKSLRPTDLISIVSFETKVRVEVPPSPASDTYYLENSISGIPLGQETDLYEGLKVAWEQIAPTAGRLDVVSRVILLTDGQPTRGKTNENDFIALANQIGQTGIPVTAIGVGSNYNELLLMKIAQATGSLWYHVSNPAFMEDIFADEVTQMSKTVIRSPTLAITAHEGTEIVDAYTMRPMVAKITLPKSYPRFDFRIKDIVAGEDQTIFLRARIPGRPPGQYPLLRVQMGELSSDISVTSTDDAQLAGVETDPYPRLLWVTGDGMTQIQRFADGETQAKVEIDTRLRTLSMDYNLPTVLRANPNLETVVTQFRDAAEATRVAPGILNEDDKKQLRQDATVLRKSKHRRK